MTYNALDNLEAATRFREQLILERQDLEATLSYEAHLASCDDDEDWNPHPKDIAHMKRIKSAIDAISEYLSGIEQDPDLPR